MIIQPKQEIFLREIQDQTSPINELIVAGGSGTGKSLICMYYVIKFCLQYQGAVVAICRSEATRLKRATMDTFWEVCRLQGLQSNVHFRYRENMNDIVFNNGSKILLVHVDYRPSDPKYRYLQGYQFSMVYCDEASEITAEGWEALKLRIRWKIDEFGVKPKIFGSCNPNKFWLYNEFYKPWKEGTLPKNRFFLNILAADNIFQSEDYWESLKTATPMARQIYWLGNWEADTTGELIEYEKILELRNNTWVANTDKTYYITADIALQGSDKAVIYLWQGLHLINKKVLQKTSIKEIESIIVKWKNQYKINSANIIVDSDGVGNGLPQLFNVKGFVNNGKTFGNENFFNLKTQCYYKLAEKINEGLIYIEPNLFDPKEWQDLLQELQEVKSDLPKSDKLTIVGKDKIKSNIGRSPDYADAMMMRMYYEVQGKIRYSRIF